MTKAEETPNVPQSTFLYVVCQNGAEAATKLELMSAYPELRLAFSRPGFITFKIHSEGSTPTSIAERFSFRSTLVRTAGWSVGKMSSEDAGELVNAVCDHPKLAEAQQIHIWQRDPVIPGKNGFEPGVSALAQSMADLISENPSVKERDIVVNRVAKPDELVFDVVMVEPNEWWFGYHYATTTAGRWPGGAPKIDTTVEIFSRAYFKLKEALLWSGITIAPGDVCAEIGSAPGGACQLLLEMDAQVIGIDPAEMEQEVFDHDRFFHIRKRGVEVRKREFSDVHWLLADLNTAPNATLDLISEIVSHESVRIKGIILTLKLSEWKEVKDIPAMIKRVKGMGFQVVKARQLAFNRQEFCLAAVKDKFTLRSAKQKR
jgi:23S rRNA (cytidine2498-2'-O)-methyltransferase